MSAGLDGLRTQTDLRALSLVLIDISGATLYRAVILALQAFASSHSTTLRELHIYCRGRAFLAPRLTMDQALGEIDRALSGPAFSRLESVVLAVALTWTTKGAEENRVVPLLHRALPATRARGIVRVKYFAEPFEQYCEMCLKS